MGVVFFGVIGATYFLLGRVSKGFIPEVDNDSMSCTVEAAQGTSYYKMVEYISKVTAIIRKDPNIESFMTSARGRFGSTATQSRLWIQLKTRPTRPFALPEVIHET